MLRTIRKDNQFVVIDDPDLAQEVGEFDRLKLIDDEAHGTLIRMRADIDHRPGKTLVAHSRHGKQELPV